MSPLYVLGSESLERAVASLNRDEVVVVPTDTVYGLAARADSPTATDRLFALKGRAPDVPLAVLVADVEQAADLLDEIPPWAAELVATHWPGPLTIVGRQAAGIDLAIGATDSTVGVRCPDHGFVRALARRIGPLAVTSANRHREPTPPTARGVAAHLGIGADHVVVDGGRCDGEPSTVVDITGAAPVVLRAGPVAVG
jgi:tRNA threonylcarbamoyl adenosine modification protein (Sua5/YciO/YrdC/YwlC family)